MKRLACCCEQAIGPVDGLRGAYYASSIGVSEAHGSSKFCNTKFCNTKQSVRQPTD